MTRSVGFRGLLLLALALSSQHAIAPSARPESQVLADMTVSQTPRVYELLFVVVTDPAHPRAGLLTDPHYEAVLRSASIAMQRESLNRVQLHYSLLDVPISELGDTDLAYSHRSFLGWHAALAQKAGARTYDILAFGPDRNLPWCSDAHSLGVQLGAQAFTCLQGSPRVALSSHVLIHKIFHTFGFFHQQSRNKQYRLLDWELGLPGYVALADLDSPLGGSQNAETEDIAFFTPMALSALGIVRPDGKGCDFTGGLHCQHSARSDVECRDVAGPFCRDADHDGLVDLEDGYPVSPPRQGVDSDRDGTPDSLDLCPGNVLNVLGNVRGGPMNFWSTDPVVELDVSTSWGPVVEVRWVTGSPALGKEFGEVIAFLDQDEQADFEGKVSIPSQQNPIRLTASYRHEGRMVSRTMFLYSSDDMTSPMPWAYFNEKAWFYFGRFGCDVPAAVDLYTTKTFDADADGLPDSSVLPVADRFASYDWDGDGVPDRLDTLPTVAGGCSDAHVRGVKDSDGDGLCDPGYLVYEQLPSSVQESSYFGELPTGMGNDDECDRCPYFPGTAADKGCPARRDGKSWYADAYPFGDP